MSRKKEIVRVSLLLVIILSGFVLIKPVKVESTTEPFFTLKAIANAGGIKPDLLFFLKQHCARIGIDIQVYTYDWPTFLGHLVTNGLFDYDISCLTLVDFAGDPGPWIKVYGEEGGLNFAGYDTSMDWDEELGTGINEWYLQTGETMMPPESEERVQHYWSWQDYMMDKILPIQPLFVGKSFIASWSNLQGYNYKEGLLASWGNMSFTGLHTGQNSQDELVVAVEDWQNLNPLFGTGFNDQIAYLILDPAIWFDSQTFVYPHLATDISLINDTHIRIKIREGIKWNSDPDGLFTNEFVDVDDFYFTYYAMKHISDIKDLYYWIEDIEKVDQNTLDIFVDNNQSTYDVNEPFASFLKYLEVGILPEHYLNQTQLADGQTPDIIDPSWEKFSEQCFGTGLFELDSHVVGVQTTLSVDNDCWYLDPSIDKSDMDFVNRFGNFTGGLNKIKFRTIPNRITQISEFELGKIDLVPITGYLDKIEDYIQNPELNVQSSFEPNLIYFGYNMRENRNPIGSREPCPNYPSMTIGLAIRKAIAYAVDREEINNVLYRGENVITDYPFYEVLGHWRYPNIIRYNHDLDEARKYMAYANFTSDILIPDTLDPWEITGIVLTSVFIAGVIVFTFFKTKKK